ncbi:MAG: hypothetical protein DAHOPDDO_03319 [Ignavibacteriaceae bacterium]|nr:hypothetical protein [Ignavibacteriaceae bacterium]
MNSLILGDKGINGFEVIKKNYFFIHYLIAYRATSTIAYQLICTDHSSKIESKPQNFYLLIIRDKNSEKPVFINILFSSYSSYNSKQIICYEFNKTQLLIDRGHNKQKHNNWRANEFLFKTSAIKCVRAIIKV